MNKYMQVAENTKSKSQATNCKQYQKQKMSDQ